MRGANKYPERIFAGQGCKISPNLLTIFPKWEYEDGYCHHRNTNSMENLKIKRVRNIVSDKSQKKIRSAVNWLCHSTRYKRVYQKSTKRTWGFKLSFITLTTPAIWSQENCVKVKEELLQPWLSYARQMFGLNNYIWKCERAQSGMIHFHITCDVFILKHKISKSWNEIMRKKGYLEEHFYHFGNYNPPSTKVHAVRDTKDLAAEICKYMCKSDEQTQFIEGRLWGCSYDLSTAIGAQTVIPATAQGFAAFEAMRETIKNRDVEIEDKRDGSKHYVATLFFPSPRDMLDNVAKEVRKVYQETVDMLRNGCSYNLMNGYEVA
jgi:hypothetical protein